MSVCSLGLVETILIVICMIPLDVPPAEAPNSKREVLVIRPQEPSSDTSVPIVALGQSQPKP
jgi:hypothetical protein